MGMNDPSFLVGNRRCEYCRHGKFAKDARHGFCEDPDRSDRMPPFIIKPSDTCEDFDRADESIEQLSIMARDYVNQAWRHTRSKIVREMKRAGFGTEEIVAAIIAANKRAKGIDR